MLDNQQRGFMEIEGRIPTRQELTQINHNVSFEGNLIAIMRERDHYPLKQYLKYPWVLKVFQHEVFDRVWGFIDDMEVGDDLRHYFQYNHLEKVPKGQDQYSRRLQQFVELKVGYYTRMSFIEFMDLPRHEVDLIIETCISQIKKENKAELDEQGKVKPSAESLEKALQREFDPYDD